MSPSSSVTAWIDQLRRGDPAAQPLWQGYFKRLVAVARKRLCRAPRAMADEEDVALSAFKSCWRGIEQGRFPRLSDRDDLWRFLFVITKRKAIKLLKRELRDKRGGGKAGHEGSLAGESSATPALDRLPGPKLTSELVVQITDECRHLLDMLGDETLRAVAIAKMEDYTNEEVAERLECSVPTVERKLGRIRKIWNSETVQ